MTRIKLHSELMAVMYGRMSTLNRVDLPPPTSLNTRKYLECWDIENHLGSKERDIVLAELRLEVRRVKLSQVPHTRHTTFVKHTLCVALKNVC